MPQGGQGVRRSGLRAQPFPPRRAGAARLRHARRRLRRAHHADHAHVHRLRAGGDHLHLDAGHARLARHGGRVRLVHYRDADAARPGEALERDQQCAAARPGGGRERVRAGRFPHRGRSRHGDAGPRQRRARVRERSSIYPSAPSPRSPTSTCTSGPAKPSRWSAARAGARPRWSTCCRGSMRPPPAACCSTATTCRVSRSTACAPTSRSSARRSCCSTTRSSPTSPTAAWAARRRRTSSRRRRRRTPWPSSARRPRGSTR